MEFDRSVSIDDPANGQIASSDETIGLQPKGRFDPSRIRETGGAGPGLAIVRALAGGDQADATFAHNDVSDQASAP